jgi:nucleoside-diphosphate-sugar epimerase
LKILLAGCGDIGQRTGARLAPNHQCFGLKRNPRNLPNTITPIAGDVTDAKGLQTILSEGFDVVVVTLTPAAFTQVAYHDAYLAGAKALSDAISNIANRPKLPASFYSKPNSRYKPYPAPISWYDFPESMGRVAPACSVR